MTRQLFGRYDELLVLHDLVTEALVRLVTSTGRERESGQGGCGEQHVLPAQELGSHPITSLLVGTRERVWATTPCPHIGRPVRTPIGRYPEPEYA